MLTNVFGDAYREYQRTTPFLVPTIASFTKFVQTLTRPEQRPEADETPSS